MLDEKSSAALIAGVVALTISLFSAYFGRRALKKEIESKYSERLTDLRFEYYTEAFLILRSLNLTKGSRSDAGEIFNVREELRNWHAGPASLVISSKAQRAYNRLRRKLIPLSVGKTNLEENSAETEKLFLAIREFRNALKYDLRLLFDELESDKFDEFSE